MVLPDSLWDDRSVTIEHISNAGVPTFDAQGPAESKVVCAQLLTAHLQPPLVVVAHSDACLMLPAVALSLRAQHRDVLAYVLIDPDAPPATDIWPESPVFVISSTGSRGSSLRGWTVIPAEGNVPQQVGQLIVRLVLD